MQAIRFEKKVILIATLIFILFSIVGFVASDPINESLKQAGVWEQFQQKVEDIKQDPGLLNVFQVILSNNLLATASMIGLGLFFGVYPVIGLAFNGLLLGVVIGISSEQTGSSPVTLFVTQILPHGILELPALIFAAALGIRLGILSMGTLAGLGSAVIRKRNQSAWKAYLERVPSLVIGVAVMLTVAAFIESSLIVYFS
ncbi:stage II sporulation protein M [Melghirimyces algeriensis]|uniref:Stage II sporulation protein M n=2 Tax=Melghirimyces algeriensis TaxID=910412 RepID=A0A521E657_9BACL|nr:stage II sporulation protein M [Melghirimyces algeriensis]